MAKSPTSKIDDDIYITQTDIDSGRLKLVKRHDETHCLLKNPANVAHLKQSIAELKAGKARSRKLIK